MSALKCPDSMNADLQIWNNATFDSGDCDDPLAIRDSWPDLKPNFVNLSVSGSLESNSNSSKENQSPAKKILMSATPIKSLQPKNSSGVSQEEPIKPLSLKNSSEGETRDVKKIDAEIAEIEEEISRLSSKLEDLRFEKAEKSLKSIERRGRIVPAKFLEPKSIKNRDALKQKEESPSLSAKTKRERRGLSLGPVEIFSGTQSRILGKQEITPIQPIKDRRKSCFWKLQDIDEEEVNKKMGKCLTLSPKSRKNLAKIQAPKHAATTIGSKKSLKKEVAVISSIQPKKLFRDAEKLIPAKIPIKSGRIVASRYNQPPIKSSTGKSADNTDCRKRSSQENDDDGKFYDKKRTSLAPKSRVIFTEVEVGQNEEKKKQEIRNGVFELEDLVGESPLSISRMPDLLPKIRTVRCAADSPRNSGAAKRVAELVGRKSIFGAVDEEEGEGSVCLALDFAEDQKH
ncbi:hypothetical protein RJ641_013149 [Dillenia turbinata]|uniref:Uncharacterized protein n=1 Tax=Dillenia turbinata TaxID=194707 RepID=A0AAN8W3W6_9MAGN